MKHLPRLVLILAAAVGAAAPAAAQMTMEQAREEGRATGNAAKANEDLVPDDKAQAQVVPGYTSDIVPQGSYFDDPDKLVNDAQALKSNNEQYQITTDSAHTRPTFSNSEILATTDRASAVENDPTTFLEGDQGGSTGGNCTPLPPGSGMDGYYEASCNSVGTVNDCGSIAANPKCTYLRDECLDEPGQGGGPCKTVEKIYKCETPSAISPDARQYICGGDVYCLNGDCEPIVREASTEFKDALVALHAIDQAGKEFDETNYRVFSGTRETCHKPVFGLINCCAGKVSGAVPVAAGAAALAGGPAAIAAFATPFLVLFSCSQDEMKLDIKDRMGFCHKVGTYCSSSFLGICKTKQTAYCCFESKLSRILQEQGRVQLRKPWGSPKKEQCQGFTIQEFASLDLSVMDFTEVYSDFMDAAKLPDEVQTMAEIQTKIQDYYDLHGQ